MNRVQNPRCYFIITADGIELGKVVFELYQDVVPKTVKNFISFVKGKPQSGYLGSLFHRIIPGFMIQGGDFENGNGTGGYSIYGRTFEDENFDLQHNTPGLLSMANSGPNTNGSQFFVTLDKTSWLDGKHVVFGKVIKGMDIIREIETYGSENGNPSSVIRISGCGMI